MQIIKGLIVLSKRFIFFTLLIAMSQPTIAQINSSNPAAKFNSLDVLIPQATNLLSPITTETIKDRDVINIIPYGSLNAGTNLLKTNTQSSAKSTLIANSQVKPSHIPINDFTATIKHIRDSICSALENGDVKVWLTADANSNSLVISPPSEAGIEITLYCKNGLPTND